MERRTLTRRGVLALLVLAVLAGAWWLFRSPTPPVDGSPLVARVVPEGTRIRVEVLNASEVRGQARRATQLLRDAGFDIVRFGNDPDRRDTTLVLDRTGHAEWAEWAARTLGGGAAVAARPDSGRYVDLTVLLGRSWRAPPQPFNP